MKTEKLFFALKILSNLSNWTTASFQQLVKLGFFQILIQELSDSVDKVNIVPILLESLHSLLTHKWFKTNKMVLLEYLSEKEVLHTVSLFVGSNDDNISRISFEIADIIFNLVVDKKSENDSVITDLIKASIKRLSSDDITVIQIVLKFLIDVSYSLDQYLMNFPFFDKFSQLIEKYYDSFRTKEIILLFSSMLSITFNCVNAKSEFISYFSNSSLFNWTYKILSSDILSLRSCALDLFVLFFRNENSSMIFDFCSKVPILSILFDLSGAKDFLISAYECLNNAFLVILVQPNAKDFFDLSEFRNSFLNDLNHVNPIISTIATNLVQSIDEYLDTYK
jgi:hypothetical protein